MLSLSLECTFERSVPVISYGVRVAWPNDSARPPSLESVIGGREADSEVGLSAAEDTARDDQNVVLDGFGYEGVAVSIGRFRKA